MTQQEIKDALLYSCAKACVTEFMKAVKRNVLKGFRCQLGDNFLTVYLTQEYRMIKQHG